MGLHFVSAIFLALGLCACNNDDPNDMNPIPSPVPDNFNGSFLLTEMNTSVQTDLNLDGTYSGNQMDETNCYDGISWTLNQDHSFQINPHQVIIAQNGSATECQPKPNINGTWSKTGNNIDVSYFIGGNHYTEQYILSENQDTLKTFRRGLFIVGNNDTGGLANVVSDVEAVYARQ